MIGHGGKLRERSLSSFIRRTFSSSGRAEPAATNAFVQRNRWQRHSTLWLPGDNGLAVSCVGFGSPHFGATKTREAKLRAAVLQGGCNFISLSEPLELGDPRMLGDESAHLDQYLYGSWEASALDRLFEDAGDTGAGSEEDQDAGLAGPGRRKTVARNELVLMGRCSLGAASCALDPLAVRTALSQLLKYHYLDIFDLLMVDVTDPGLIRSAAAAHNSTPSSSSSSATPTSSTLFFREVVAVLEEEAKKGTIGGYGFSCSATPAEEGAADPLGACLETVVAELRQRGKDGGDGGGAPLNHQHLVAMGTPAGPFDPVFSFAQSGVGSGGAPTERKRPLFWVGERVTHRREADGRPSHYVNASSANEWFKTAAAAEAVEAAGLPSLNKQDQDGEEEGGQPRSGQRLKEALDRAIFLEKQYGDRFVTGGIESGLRQAVAAKAAFPAAPPAAPPPAEGFPLPFLPERGDVSWGNILASHLDKQISGPAEWEVARERILVPQLERGLATLGDNAETKDWAALYRVTSRELLAALDEEYVHHQRHAEATALIKRIDRDAPSLFATSGGGVVSVDSAQHASTPPLPTPSAATATLAGRCVALALGRGHDLVLSEDDWEEDAGEGAFARMSCFPLAGDVARVAAKSAQCQQE